ncbi:hypothetical protein HRbin02_00006 [Candidatus Calditenuaceae archaeon HR02]|nr:hypothetical protein HRbin02_00006 [Candidatus Calditenuaceae archaeon HR02]
MLTLRLMGMAWMGTLLLLFFGVLGIGVGLILGGYLAGERLYVYLGVTAALLSTIPLFLSALLGGSRTAQT